MERDYDLFVFVCMNVWDLLYLNAIRGWRSACRVKVCYMVEFYAGQARSSTTPATPRRFRPRRPVVLRQRTRRGAPRGKPCHHVPLAADVLRFTPYPTPPPRVIDVSAWAAAPSRCTRHSCGWPPPGGSSTSTTPSPAPSSAPRARPSTGTCSPLGEEEPLLRRLPGQVRGRGEQGQSEVGARYFEGAAAGAVLLGQAPTAPGFREDFPWPDAVVEARADGGDVGDSPARLRDARGDASAWERETRGTPCAATTGPTAGSRSSGSPGPSARPALAERLGALEALADGAEPAGADT